MGDSSNKIKTIIEIDHGILNDYLKFQSVNPNWNIGSYLNTFYDINSAIAFSKLFFPDFVEYRGCIILAFRFNQEICDKWFLELKGEISEIEKMCNLYELEDFFHINSNGYDKEKFPVILDSFGNILKKSWELNLEKLYSDRTFELQLFTEFESKYITFNSL
jgi:hypothetical protein